MKKAIPVILLLVLACSFLPACEAYSVPSASPAVSDTFTASPSVVPSPVPTPPPTATNEEWPDYEDIESFRAAMKDNYSYAIDEADKCRVNAGGTEYYLDTDKLVEMDVNVEFPLYRIKEGDRCPEYLGTTGFAFQIFGNYIYVKSDSLQEDYPDRTLTRVVNLNDLSVTPFDRNVDIFAPKQGSSVYYTYFIDNNIYIADPSLKNARKLHIEVPDQDMIEEKTGECAIDTCENISVTDLRDGWIYFNYYVFIFEGEGLYKGNYRIEIDGSRIEKTDEGQFGEDID